MSSDREVTSIVRSWLEEGVTTLPDRVLDNVLDQLPATPRRRPMRLARRFHPMNSLRIAVAAAAVLVAAVVGINLLPAQGVGTGPAPSPSPTPSPTAAPSPTPSPTSSVPILPSSEIEMLPGTYWLTDPFPLDLSFTVGEGWTSWSGLVSSGGAIYRGSPDPPNGAVIVMMIVDNVYANPCEPEKGTLDPPLGPTVDDLVDALSNQPRTDASPATDISLDGYSGSYFEYTATAIEADCSRTLSRWPSARGDRQALVDEHDKVWILDVDGVRLVIDAASFPGTSAADHAEIQAIVDSIQID